MYMWMTCVELKLSTSTARLICFVLFISMIRRGCFNVGFLLSKLENSSVTFAPHELKGKIATVLKLIREKNFASINDHVICWVVSACVCLICWCV